MLEEIDFNSNSPLSIKIQSIKKYPIHYHKDIVEIVLPIKGHLQIKSGFENVLLEEGNFFIINNTLIHSLSSDEDTVVIFFHLQLEYFKEQFPYIQYMFFRDSLSGKLLGNNENCPEVKESFKTYFLKTLISILIEVQKDEKSKCNLNKLIHRLVYQMVFKFNWLQLLKRDGEFLSSLQLDRYHRIVEYIHNHYMERIYLDAIVAREFLSKTYFSSYWKNLTTYTFQERIDFIRVIKSEFLLFNNMTVTEISQQCGFSDIKYYYKNFKRWYGCMPLEFKEEWGLYKNLENQFIDLGFSEVKSDIEAYSNRFLYQNNNNDEEMGLTHILDNYFYLKYDHTINKTSTPNNPRYLLFDPFKYSVIIKDTNKIELNFSIIDLLINLVIDFKISPQIKLFGNDFESNHLKDYLENILDQINFRYGMDILNSTQFLINYKDKTNTNNEKSIKDIIGDKVDNPNIKLYIEL